MHHSTVCTRTPGTATQGMGCTLNPPFSCAKGSQCTNCGGSGRCARFCDRTHGDSDCQDLGVPCAPIENNLGLCKPSGC